MSEAIAAFWIVAAYENNSKNDTLKFAHPQK
jgi:hypothetical protein